MDSEFDPRVTPARPDLAAEHLRDQVKADRYVEAIRYSCIASAAPIRRTPGDLGAMDDQLLFGQAFDVYEIKDGWAWGQCRLDRYVGYVRADQLSDYVLAPTHRIQALRTYVFSKPDLKSDPTRLLSMNCRVVAQEREGRFAYSAGAGWIFEGHMAPIHGPRPTDHAGIAERFLGAPYLWGGKESLGLDCSGLVQMAMIACGHDCPRDADQQEEALGGEIGFDDSLKRLQRGDLVFWKGHVGVMLDEARLLHANAHHMATAIEPLAEARDRIAAGGTPMRTIKRLG